MPVLRREIGSALFKQEMRLVIQGRIKNITAEGSRAYDAHLKKERAEKEAQEKLRDPKRDAEIKLIYDELRSYPSSS